MRIMIFAKCASGQRRTFNFLKFERVDSEVWTTTHVIVTVTVELECFQVSNAVTVSLTVDSDNGAYRDSLP